MAALPIKEGFFWGRWHTPAPGTQDDGECCSPGEWLPCNVVMNCIDPTHPDHLMAMVPGVMMFQRLDAFEWGAEILRAPIPAKIPDCRPLLTIYAKPTRGEIVSFLNTALRNSEIDAVDEAFLEDFADGLPALCASVAQKVA